MKSRWNVYVSLTVLALIMGACNEQKKENNTTASEQNMTAKEILGNPDYPAISYGGYRDTTREIQPTLEQLKTDLQILHAMGIRILRTYNVQFPHASNILKGIKELKKEQKGFEMYVMLGAWIDCKNAWTEFPPDHNAESPQNAGEIERAVNLANEYPDIVKVIAVGNEAMVKWAASYFVQPGVILKWVNHLQDLKSNGKLSNDVWITSSDNFASWGGGGSEYHVAELNELIKAVDYVSMHTYPMHDTHYNPSFWGIEESEETLSTEEKLYQLMNRSLIYAQSQYQSVKNYVEQVDPDKSIHIGETGWASIDSDNHYFGNKGARATDEYKQALYYDQMREWTNANGISCFLFEAFDEPWKDHRNPNGSENHFGLITVDGQAKYALWDEVDAGMFEGLTRNGNPILKTYGGDKAALMKDVYLPLVKAKLIPEYHP